MKNINMGFSHKISSANWGKASEFKVTSHSNGYENCKVPYFMVQLMHSQFSKWKVVVVVVVVDGDDDDGGGGNSLSFTFCSYT
jgi:hypothetical protein